MSNCDSDGISHKLTQLKQTIVNQVNPKGETTRPQILNGSANRKFFERVAQLDQTLAIILVVQLLLFHCYYQTDVQNSAYSRWFLLGGQLCGVMGCCLIFARYFEPWNQSYRWTGILCWFKEIFFKIVLCLIMPYEFIDDVYVRMTYVDPDTGSNTQFASKLNYILIILACFRVSFFGTTVLIRCRYMSPRSGRICKLYGAYPGVMFALKSIFKDNPFSFISTIFAISLLMFTFAFRVAQTVVYTTSPLTTYSNMMWMTVITMTTVGYGDFNPKTQIGRLIGALCVSWGVLIVSVMVVVLTQAFAMNRNQSQTLNILKRLQKHGQLREAAGEFIRQSVWRLWKNHKVRKAMRKSSTLIRDNNCDLRLQMRERKLMWRFRHHRRLQSMACISESQIDFYNQMTRQFERAFINLENLTGNNLMIINYLNEEYIFKGSDEERLRTLKEVR